MSFISNASSANRTSQLSNLKDFSSAQRMFDGSVDSSLDNEDDGENIESAESIVKNDGSLCIIDHDDNVDRIGPKESLSSIQELLLYVEENETGNVEFQTNKYKDFMNTEIGRESYCGGTMKSETLMKLPEAHCICPIASNKHAIVHQKIECLKCCEPSRDQQKIPELLHLLVFEVEPYSVLFSNCEQGKTYCKSIKILNRSGSTQKFKVNPLQEHSSFKMDVILPARCNQSRIPTGMSFRILITYVCKSLGNFYDTLKIEGVSITPILIEIKAYQCPVILSDSLLDSESFEEIAEEKSVANCISCFPTESTSHRIELLNYSEKFQFLILDREMWSSQSLDAIRTNNNKLVAGVFTVSPAYFQTNRDAPVVINIEFNPKEAGKYCKKLLIVCDNMSFTSLKLIGQAYLFNRNMLQFMNMDKLYCANVDDYIQSDYYLDMGSAYRGRKKTKTFIILNKSSCNLHFHWELHRYPLSGFKNLTSRMMKLTQKQGIFMGKKSRKFSMTVNMARSSVGDYRALACFYVDNLSKEKVDIPFKNYLLNRSKRRGHSLLIAIIEVHVQCKNAQIETAPQVISLKRIPLLCGPKYKFSTNVTVENVSPHPIRCFWSNLDPDEKKRVKIGVQPATVRISARAERNFVISITGISPGGFSQYLVCTANRNDCKAGVLVEGNCTMGFLHVRDDFISCGVIKIDEKLRLPVSFENNTNCKWSRMLTEYRYHSQNSYKCPKSSNNSKVKGCKRFLALQFKKRGLYDSYDRIIKFQYNKVNTNIEKNVIWCSLLKWKVGDVVDYIGVIADIQRPLVTLSEGEQSDDHLGLNYMSTIQLELRNHSRTSAVFTWCNPIGDQRSCVQCKFEPAKGILKKYEKCQILIHITPLKMIIIEDLHFICIVEGMMRPLLVSLTGRLESIKIEFNWQESAKDTEVCTAVWQSMGDDSWDNKTCASISGDEGIVVPGVNPEGLSISPSGDFGGNGAIIEDTHTVDEIEGGSILDTNNNYRSTCISFNMELNNDFIGKIVIEVDSCHAANKSLLQVRNCTKATVSYITNILNFHPKGEFISRQIPDEHDYLKWKSLTQPELGVVICVQNPFGQINGFETIELRIWAFATSWGIYKDVLIIDGDGQLPSAYFEVEVICTSNPIRFPALCKPVLRLSAIHYKDNTQSYPIRVKNNSSTNILVHWSVHNILSYKESRKRRPFKLDLWDASEDVKNWGLTLNPFYGQVYLDTFSVGEPYFRLKAWSEKILTLNVEPHDVNTENVKMPLTLNAVLVACVFRDPEYEVKHANWNQNRMAPVETAHLLIKINLDQPKFVLLDAEEDTLQFIIRGDDLWNSKIYRQSKTLIWQNQSSVSTSVSIDIEKPFKIELQKNGVKLNNTNRPVNLNNGESIEMLLNLQIMDGKGEIERLIEDIPVANPSTQAEELSGPRLDRGRVSVKKMKVSLDGKLENTYDVELTIILPKIKLSVRRITFDQVFNGTTKCQTFDIASEDNYPVNYQIVPAAPIQEEENVFTFYPSSGVIATRKAPATIFVYFTPRFSIYYRNKYLVTSSVHSHHLKFVVSGHGTYNSKHMGNYYPPI